MSQRNTFMAFTECAARNGGTTPPPKPRGSEWMKNTKTYGELEVKDIQRHSKELGKHRKAQSPKESYSTSDLLFACQGFINGKLDDIKECEGFTKPLINKLKATKSETEAAKLYASIKLQRMRADKYARHIKETARLIDIIKK